MNRISFCQRPAPFAERPLAERPAVEPPAKRPRAACATAGCQYYFAPLHYESNYAYPLIVWLHGPHNNELELKQIMPLVSMRNYVGAAPRATLLSEQDDGSQIQFRWQEGDGHIELAESRLWECIDGVCQRYHVSPERVFLAGRECGGTMALRLALRNPDRFAGALSFGGPFPAGAAPLVRLRQARRLPLFFATTAQSLLYPQTLVCEHLKLLHSAGMSVTLRQYPGDDALTTLMLTDMDRWIMEHIATDRPRVRGEMIEHRSVN